MKVFKSTLIVFGWLIAGCALAQHEHHSVPPSPTPPSGQPSAPAAEDPMKGMDHSQMDTSMSDEPDTGRNLFQSDMNLMTGMTG